MADTPQMKPAPVVSAEVKPRTIDITYSESWWHRAARHLPSGEQVVSFLRTLIWVAPLTLLIWVYAEREQTVTVPAPPFPIEVKTAAPNRIVTLRGPADGNLVAEFSGPRARIDRVKELLLPKPDGAAIQILIDPQLSTGPQELLAVSQLNNHPIFKNNGITVKSCQPPYLKVDVDELKEEELPVVAPDNVVEVSKERPVFSPPTVKIRAPSQRFHDAAYQRQWYVVAQITPDQIKNRPPGPISLENVPVQWFYKENVTLVTPTVKATLTLKQADIEHMIDSVPVRLDLPPGTQDEVRVEYKSTIPNVKVIGPPEQIELIKKEPGKHVIARLGIDAFATPGKPEKGRLEFKLPPGVSVLEETRTRADDWSYTLQKRTP